MIRRGLVVLLGLLLSRRANAQGAAPVDTPPPSQGGSQGGATAGGTGTGAGGAGASGAGAGGTSGAGATQPNITFFPGGVAPTPPGQVLGGGNVTSSSSKPRMGGENDTFDLNTGSATSNVMRGSADGPVFGTTGPVRTSMTGPVPDVHVVRRGDTLWGICDQYFQNPYLWPRIWSYNPQIQNPHYIEPGERVRLRDPADKTSVPEPRAASSGIVTGRGKLPADTVFLREEGFIEDEETDTWGEITGAPEDKMFLADTDDVYLRVLPKHEVKVGQELTIFRPIRSVGKGKLVEILGTVRVNQVSPRDPIARATVVETLDVIERGARFGAIPRRFEVVPPVRDDRDVSAQVLTSLTRRSFYGQHQVVYIDKGQDDGLMAGNRLLVVRKGDAWRASLPANGAARRIDMDSDSPAQIELVPPSREEKRFPEEVVGELRVLSARKSTSMCVVTQSSREIEVGDVAKARKGY